jgi:hypothetical protein
MFFKQKRILSLDKHFEPSFTGRKLRVVARLSPSSPDFQKLGFRGDEPVPGQTVVPDASLGPVCRFNAEGRDVPQRHLPKETCYRSQLWTRTEYHGRDNPVEVQTVVSIPYQRYPRENVPPPGVRLIIHAGKDGEFYVATELMEYGKSDLALLTAINVMLEVFGQCEVQQDDGSLLRPPKLQSLDWTLLPAGEYPWAVVKSAIASSFKGTSPNVLAAIQWRLQKLWKFDPDSVAIGQAGFGGYVVFCYKRFDMYVLESRRPDNATYILGSNWTSISKLTKAEILSGNLHKRRVIHNDQWEAKISGLFPPGAAAA